MVRTAILAHFRSRWLDGALPLVVEHRSDDLETLCASPSLWMGARELHEELSDAGLGPGRSLRLALPLGIRWVQALVAGLRAGCAIDLRPASPERAAATVESGRLRFDAEPALLPHQLAWVAPNGTRFSRDDLDRCVPDLVRRHALADGERVLVGIEATDGPTSLAAVLGTLWAGCELHTLMDADAHRSRSMGETPIDRHLGSAPFSHRTDPSE